MGPGQENTYGSGDDSLGSTRTEPANEPVTEALSPALGTAAATDRCAACGSRLSNDQRYCLECGERRGAARFSATPGTRAVAAAPARTRRVPRLSSGSTLIAGVGTLLLAMGIGVLIGRTGTSPAQTGASRVQVVSVAGGSGTTAAAGAVSSVAKHGGSAKKHSSAKHAKALANNNGKNVSAANATETVKNLPPPTVTMGQSGHGPGYTNGHFTGKFFGP
jgi:hypothetical protein